MDAGSAAAFYAGTVLLRKTFEAVAQRSVSSLFSRLHSRFRGQSQLQSLQKDLEARLQGALDMALQLINDILSFQEELEAQSYNESIVKLSPADAASRLESFLTRLDSILPYLSVAMNAVSLLKMTNNDLSPSRLLEASYLVRTAGSRQGVATSICAKLHQFETRLTLPRWQEKLMSCTVTLRRTYGPSSDEDRDYEVVVMAEKEGDDHVQTMIRMPITNICAVALTLDNSPSTPSKEPSDKLVHYALQFFESVAEEEFPSVTMQHESRVGKQGGGQSDAAGKNKSFSARISKLGVLEYALRLCMLQILEEKAHWLVPDERIRMFFADPRFVSEPVANVQRIQDGYKHESSTSSTLKKSTPGQFLSRTPSGSIPLASRLPVRRLSVADMLSDLKLESGSSSKS